MGYEMNEGSVIACKNCKNSCRLVLPGILSVSMMNELETYNLWQCDECGALFRELADHKRIVGNHICDL